MATKVVKPAKLINVVRQAKKGQRAKAVPNGVGNLARALAAPMTGYKVCKGCQKRHKVTDFFLRKRGGSVRSSRCRFCAAEAQRQVRLRKKEVAKKAKKGRKSVT